MKNTYKVQKGIGLGWAIINTDTLQIQSTWKTSAIAKSVCNQLNLLVKIHGSRN